MNNKAIINDLEQLSATLASYESVFNNSWVTQKAKDREMAKLRANRELIRELYNKLD